jgi:hypothetical protein
MAKKLICQNCGKPVSEQNPGCLLHDLVQVLRERGEHSERKVRQIHASVDADALWNRLGPVVDEIGDGWFSIRRN